MHIRLSGTTKYFRTRIKSKFQHIHICAPGQGIRLSDATPRPQRFSNRRAQKMLTENGSDHGRLMEALVSGRGTPRPLKEIFGFFINQSALSHS